MKIVYIVAAVLVVVALGYLFLKNNVEAPSDTAVELTPNETSTGSTVPQQEIIDAKVGKDIAYSCKDDKKFTAAFGDKVAKVNLGENGTFTLELISVHDEDGTKFSNEGEAVVLWVKDMSAYVLEAGEPTYTYCTEGQS
jgi:hypothetical protein